MRLKLYWTIAMVLYSFFVVLAMALEEIDLKIKVPPLKYQKPKERYHQLLSAARKGVREYMWRHEKTSYGTDNYEDLVEFLKELPGAFVVLGKIFYEKTIDFFTDRKRESLVDKVNYIASQVM